jgi:hypothetical protein
MAVVHTQAGEDIAGKFESGEGESKKARLDDRTAARKSAEGEPPSVRAAMSSVSKELYALESAAKKAAAAVDEPDPSP